MRRWGVTTCRPTRLSSPSARRCKVIRTAIFDWLFARHHGGDFIIRIEDTDQNRKVEGAVEVQLNALRWLGLDWDEGPVKGGQYGPYVQSQRLETYRRIAGELIDGGHAYRCYCSSERLVQVREEQAYTLGTAAFAWGFTMTEIYRIRHVTLTQFDSFNQFSHFRQLMNAAASRQGGVVSANNATLYSGAVLDLSLEPIVVDIPPISDRYFTINYFDFYQKVGNLSNHTIGRQGGSYAFVGPKWEGVLPSEVKRVNIATNMLGIIGRTEVKGRMIYLTLMPFKINTR